MNSDIHQYKILIIDFGSQYAQLIARRVREAGVYCELMRPDVSNEKIIAFAPNGVILSGGPETVREQSTPRAPKIIFELGCPVLGICYGMQTMALQLGGVVESSDQCEFGFAECEIDVNNSLFGAAHIFGAATVRERLLSVWMSHGDHVTKIPPGFTVIAKTKNAPIAAMAHLKKQFYGLQFHPEVTHTECGQAIIASFVKNICHCESVWTSKNIIKETIERVREKVGKEKVLLGLSGGVDSSVVAALLHEAIGDQLICVFVDTGLLRLKEGDEVMNLFADNLGVKVIRADAQTLFLKQLSGVTDPEEKRKIVGKKFIDVFQKSATHAIRFLAQGTIYPDVIESANSEGGASHVIKSHHNVGGLPNDLHFELIEPLRELFKDEVRALGVQLGLPQQLLNRHPFPGPGLAVRIMGEVKKEYVSILQKADAIFIECLREKNLYDSVSQAFAVFLPIKSVGVKGDARCYEYVIALRAVTTVDFMTAEWADLPHDFLGEVSNRILNEVPHVSRVVYDISGKPPATIEWE